MKLHPLKLLLLACTFWTSASHGAETAPPNLGNELAQAVKSARGTPPAIFSIDFPGGSIRDFLKVISGIPGVSVSIVSAGEASDLDASLPSFSLRNTTATVMLQVLSRLLLPRGFDLVPLEGDPNSAVAVLARQDAQKPRPTTVRPTEFESFQLAPYLAEQSVDDIVTAIRSAWTLDPSHDPNALQLKFHPPTSILLISGPRDSLNMAAKIISQLKQPPSDRARLEAAAGEAMRRGLERQKAADDWNKARQPATNPEKK